MVANQDGAFHGSSGDDRGLPDKDVDQSDGDQGSEHSRYDSPARAFGTKLELLAEWDRIKDAGTTAEAANRDRAVVFDGGQCLEMMGRAKPPDNQEEGASARRAGGGFLPEIVFIRASMAYLRPCMACLRQRGAVFLFYTSGRSAAW